MSVRSRRTWGLVLCILLVVGCTKVPGAAPEPAASSSPRPVWRTEVPEALGFDPVVLTDALVAIRDGGQGGHAVVLVRDGAVVLDATIYPYDGTTPHQVGSITRTIVSTLVGIAADRGVLSLDDPVVSFFPDRTIANRDARKDRMTVRDLVTMTSGFGCASGDDTAAIAEMTAGTDWAGAALDAPMVAEPGAVFRLCSPTTHLLSAILERATGVTTLEFARQFLFEPLGISDVRWTADPQGTTRGWTDLYLLPADLARIGLLWARHGSWGDRHVVPEAWVAAATEAAVATGGTHDYGLGWWTPRTAVAGTVEASGGGELLQVRPDLDLVVAVAGGGSDPVDLAAPLVAGLVSPGQPLITDRFGENNLATALESLRRGPDATTLDRPAGTVKAIAKVTWVLDPNPLGLSTLRLDLRSLPAGNLTMAFESGAAAEAMPVGLDGRYRIGLDARRRPIAIRASWPAGRTLLLDVDEIAEGHAWTLRLTFDADARTVAVEGLDRGQPTGFAVEGRAAE